MINKFSGEYRFLSNFYNCRIEYEGLVYPTVEHAFQAAKTTDEAERRSVRDCSTAGQAKRRGREVTLRPDWDTVKVDVMHELLLYKFYAADLGGRLCHTGDQELIEGNTWGDTFWGVCRGKGSNHLGRLLMQVRREINAAMVEEIRKTKA